MEKGLLDPDVLLPKVGKYFSELARAGGALGIKLNQLETIEKGKGNITQKYLKDLISLGREFYSSYPQVGLAIKTYQSDIFNNWINTEWIDGENGINAQSSLLSAPQRHMHRRP